MAEIEEIELINPKEVAKLLKVSLPGVYAMAKRKQIPSVQWESPATNGKRAKSTLRFKAQDIFDFIEAHYRPT